MADKEKLGNKVGKLAGAFGKKAVDVATVAGGKTLEAVGTAGKKTTELTGKAKEKVLSTKDNAMKAMDVNGDGHVDIEDIIILGMKTPGIRINRSEYLQKELSKNYPEDVVNKAVETNPATAGITVEEADKLADEVIKFERNCVSGISAALGMPGGAAMAATIPADIIQYYGYMLRAAQKMLYLYGFPEIQVEGEGQTLDTETMNVLVLCMGVMYGVAGANNAIKGVAKALATGVEKQLMRKALTKGTIYPIVKSVSKWFGVKMTKEVFAGFFKKAIPVVGGVIGGGLTFVSFKPCCDKLKVSLRDTRLANLNSQDGDEPSIIDTIAEEIKNGTELDEKVLEEAFAADTSDVENA